MKRLKTEFNALVNRGVDRHLRLAVTGLSRSGKTAFITAMVNQLLNVHAGARLPLLSAVREERLLGVKRVPQRDFGIPRFTYDEGILQLYGNPPAWPTPTRGVSEIRLALRYRSNDSLLRHFKDTSTLYLEIVDYPGEWLLDLPMLAQDYLSWSRQMNGLLQGQRAEWAAKWRQLCDGLDPLAPRIICISVNRRDCILFSLDGLFCRAIWRARQHCSFSRGRMWTPSASQNWRRRINRPTLECCANALTTIAKKWSKGSTKIIFYALIARLCWSTVCNRLIAGRRRLMICVSP